MVEAERQIMLAERKIQLEKEMQVRADCCSAWQQSCGWMDPCMQEKWHWHAVRYEHPTPIRSCTQARLTPASTAAHPL
jgi:hypothetical protein